MTIDFLIGAVRASNDLHPAVQTEIEEILYRAEPAEPKKVKVKDRILERELEYDACGSCGFIIFQKERYCPNCGKAVARDVAGNDG